MTRRRLQGQFGKTIEAAFTPYNLVPGPDDPPVLKVMSFEEFSHLQGEEIVPLAPGSSSGSNSSFGSTA